MNMNIKDWAKNLVKETAPSKIRNYVYSGYLDRENEWATVYTRVPNADNILDDSNFEALYERLCEVNEKHVEIENDGHWLVNTIERLEVRFFENGELTEIADDAYDILKSLEHYPVLDEDDYIMREHEHALELLEHNKPCWLEGDKWKETISRSKYTVSPDELPDPHEITLALLEEDEFYEEFVELLPRGSGLDHGWYVKTDDNKIVLQTEYHAMNDTGFYVGWIHVVAIVTFDTRGKASVTHIGANTADILQCENLGNFHIDRHELEESITVQIEESLT